MGVARDAPALDIAYKLAAYGGRGRLKLSPGKGILPGQKQVFRRTEGGMAAGDVIGRFGEELSGCPLLVKVMDGGARLEAAKVTLDQARENARREIERLPRHLQAIEPADPRYPVTLSDTLTAFRDEIVRSAGR